MSRAEAMESFITDGWIEVKCENYDEFLNAIDNLSNEQFISDFHVKHLFIFPASSKRYAINEWIICFESCENTEINWNFSKILAF